MAYEARLPSRCRVTGQISSSRGTSILSSAISDIDDEAPRRKKLCFAYIAASSGDASTRRFGAANELSRGGFRLDEPPTRDGRRFLAGFGKPRAPPAHNGRSLALAESARRLACSAVPLMPAPTMNGIIAAAAGFRETLFTAHQRAIFDAIAGESVVTMAPRDAKDERAVLHVAFRPFSPLCNRPSFSQIRISAKMSLASARFRTMPPRFRTTSPHWPMSIAASLRPARCRRFIEAPMIIARLAPLMPGAPPASAAALRALDFSTAGSWRVWLAARRADGVDTRY